MADPGDGAGKGHWGATSGLSNYIFIAFGNCIMNIKLTTVCFCEVANDG